MIRKPGERLSAYARRIVAVCGSDAAVFIVYDQLLKQYNCATNHVLPYWEAFQNQFKESKEDDIQP